MKQPKEIWAAGCNWGGLWSKKPIKMRLQKTMYGIKVREYYDSTGNLSVTKLGYDNSNPDCVTFASAKKEDVELFLLGAHSAMDAVKRVCK